MKENSKISVIMTVYNHEKFIDEAINSIISQTYQNFELIVVDDSSTDKTLEIVKSFSDPRINVIKQDHQGPSVAINSGLKNSTGEFIAFMSGDDVSHNNRLECQVSQIGLHDADIIFTRPDLIGPQSEKLTWDFCPWFFDKEFSNNSELYRKFFYFGNFLVASSAFTRRSTVEEIGLFSPGLIQLQDFDYWIRAIKKNKEIKIFNNPLISYRYLFGKNLSDKTNDNRLRIESVKVYRDFFRETPIDVFSDAFTQDMPFEFKNNNVDIQIIQSLLFFHHPDPIIRCVGAERIVEQLENEETFQRFSELSDFNLIDFFSEENLIDLDEIYPEPKFAKLRRLVKKMADQRVVVSLSEVKAKREIQDCLEAGDNERAVNMVKGLEVLYPRRTMIQTLGKIIKKIGTVIKDSISQLNKYLHGKIVSIHALDVFTINKVYDYSKQKGLILFEGDRESIFLNRPHVIGNDIPDLDEGSAVCPKPYIARLSDVIITGGSDYVITNDGKILNDELVDFSSEEFGIKSPFVKFRHKDKLIHGFLDKTPKKISKGILISSGHDFNYFHWMVECLPKLLLVDSNPELRDIPILIPHQLHSNLEAALDKCNVFNHEIIKISMGIPYHIDELIYPSALSRILDRYEGELAFDSDIVLSNKWILKVREIMTDSSTPSVTKPWRRLFLTRRKGTRSVADIDEIERAMLNYNFEIIELEDVSLDFQIQLFSQASFIVSPSGAALTNMMFCPPETKVVVLMSDHEISNYYLWTQLGDLLNLDIAVIIGERLYNQTNRYSVHDDYRIDIDALIKEIQKRI